MLNYNTNLQAQPPMSQEDLQRAMKGIRLQSPYGYKQSHQDVLSALGDANAAQYAVQAEKANADFGARKLQAQRDLALQGLQQLATSQQQRSDLANARSAIGYGMVNNLLSGLFR